MTDIIIKRRLSEYIHSEWKEYRDAKGDNKEYLHPMTDRQRENFNWFSFFQIYKNEAQEKGLTIQQRWEKETYPDAFKNDGTYRKDWRIKMGLPIQKIKKRKKNDKPDPIPEVIEEVEEIIDG